MKESRQIELAGIDKKESKNKFKLIYDLITYLLSISIITFSILFAFSSDPQKSFLGFRFYSVLTESMQTRDKTGNYTDGFEAGSLLIIKITQPSSIRIGDIITFSTGNSGKSYLTHRVVEIKTEWEGKQKIYFVTRGDNNNVDDKIISSDRMIGKKVFAIPYAGSIADWIRQNYIILIAVIVAEILLIIAFSIKKRGSNNEKTTKQ